MDSREQTYWTTFYNTFNLCDASPFARFVAAYLNSLDAHKVWRVLDAGCGNGRDSYFLAHHSCSVVGVDSSFAPAPADNCVFERGDMVSLDKSGFDVIYSRFSFHSISTQQQELFLQNITVPGTLLCLEARSDADHVTVPVHGTDHFRNLIHLDTLLQQLAAHHFDVLVCTEGKNLAPYKDEDPVCVRVIARLDHK